MMASLEIVDQFLAKLPEANWEHWHSPSKNRAHETWIVCRDCNLRLRDDGSFKQKSEVAFNHYQQKREQKFCPLF